MPRFQNQNSNPKVESEEKDEFNQPESQPVREITGETLSLQAVENFFKYTINPHLIETKIEKTVAATMRDRGGINLNLIIAVAIVIGAAGVAYSMISNQTQINDANNRYVACATQLAQKNAPVVNNPEITTTTQPIIPIAVH